MLRDDTRRAIELQREADRHVGGNGARRDRIERFARGAREQLAMHSESRRTRRDEREDLSSGS